ncbi:single-stranded DNA-binding protein [Neisseria gonorrhoeae]|uniref:Single-stranded DNA-binding protein n=13 Tax=Neisseria gonorrhoeae TaxID=485 RepID=A0AAQ1IN28_NEIGO|nr:single-stranded DNA-binding protein [Neisseria gonorrhoeae]KLS37591.1 single-stranded DNA-binding protein [Neisseria gonorrhoeae SK23020]ACF29436.1 putative single-stranded DNA binding protein [Neisseria gonorrhoeae NCCP11945]AKP10511.1 Single-stranded DNA-binding protein [Neisseria gonorrhoeae]AKP15939.1 Single-stranded DNA-binding protein [Neisseria gonorrhoeae]ANJ49783.1 single-stranded DNA-binding protein [Neisseria gonorrhoeae]
MSLNKVILIGRLGRDPEVRYMPNGEAVCNFSVATSETWNDRNGQRVERTEWHNITMYRKLAEIAGQYLKKGGLVYLEGRIQSRKYQGKDGIERTAYDIVANEMKMLGGRNENSGGAPYDEGYGQNQEAYQRPAQQSRQPAPDAPSHPQEAPAAPRRQPVPAAAPVEDIDDDIPF